jgi:hypothetical protein
MDMASGSWASVADVGGSGVSLLPHERVAGKVTGNHIRDGKAYEGYLYVTSKRLVYVPWSASQVRGAVPFAIPLTEVTGADSAPRGTNWRDGSWRRRLRITKSSGGTELFVVWRVRHAIGLVERARQEAGRG